jgi:hypothetical protein
MRWPKTFPSVLAAVAAALCACSQQQLGPRAALEVAQAQADAVPPPPPFPRPENLARIETGAAGSFELFVDTASVQVLGQGEYRYTLVARSGAASNVSFEGLRCLSRERRFYAFGRTDGSWAPAKKSEWTTFSQTQFSQAPVILSQQYFCPNYLPVLTVQEAVQALRYGRRQDAR